MKVDGGRKVVMSHCQAAYSHLERATGTKRMAVHGFGAAHRNLIGKLTEDCLESHCFSLIVERCGRGMSADVVDITDFEPSLVQRLAHDPDNLRAIGPRRCHVICICGSRVTQH